MYSVKISSTLVVAHSKVSTTRTPAKTVDLVEMFILTWKVLIDCTTLHVNQFDCRILIGNVGLEYIRYISLASVTLFILDMASISPLSLNLR